MDRTAVVVLTWNDLPLLERTLTTFNALNGARAMYVVDNGSTDGTAEYLADHGYRVIRHERNLGVFVGTMSGWTHAASRGHEFILNLQSDFPSLLPLPLDRLEAYLDANRDVGFVRLNRKRHHKTNDATGERIAYGPWEPIGQGFEVAKYNYHMAFHPYLFRASFVDHLSRAPLRTERGLMNQYAQLGRQGARLRPHCFRTLPCNRHGTPGWMP